MWERIGASSGIVIGAVVLFLLFALVLFIMERDELIKKRTRRRKLYIVPKTNCNQRRYTESQHRIHRTRTQNVYHDIDIRKIS